jgi:hypothetical protein
VIAQNVALRVDRQIGAMALLPAHRVIAQRVVPTVTEIHVRVHAHLQIVPIVRPVLMVTGQNVATIVAHRVIAQPVAHMVTETHVRHHVHLQIVHVAITHSAEIVHAQAMIAERDHLHVIANAVVDQIVLAVGSPMIAMSVHAVALAKSA